MTRAYAVKLATTDDPTYDNIDNPTAIKKRKYYGGSFTGVTGPIGTAPSLLWSDYPGINHYRRERPLALQG